METGAEPRHTCQIGILDCRLTELRRVRSGNTSIRTEMHSSMELFDSSNCPIGKLIGR